MKNINFHSCLKINEKLWFVTVDGYLMNYDLKRCVHEMVYPINLAQLKLNQITDKMIYHNNCIYFVEQDGTALYEYQIDINKCVKYGLSGLEIIDWTCFSGVYIIDGIIYLFTKKGDKVLCFDTANKTFSNLDVHSDEVLNCSVSIADTIYFAGSKAIYEFDLKEKNFNKIYSNDNGIKWINSFADDIYILTQDEEIYLYNTVNGKISLVYKENDTTQHYNRFIITQNKMFVFPLFSGNIISVNKNDGSVERIAEPSDAVYQESEWSRYYGYCEDENDIWMANRLCNYTVSISKIDENVSWIKMPMITIEEQKPYLKLRQVLSEKDMSLKEYITEYLN